MPWYSAKSHRFFSQIGGCMRFLGLSPRARVYLGEVPYAVERLCCQRFDGETTTEIVAIHYENSKVLSEECGTFTDSDGLIFELERHTLYSGRIITEAVETRVAPDGAEVTVLVLKDEAGNTIPESVWDLPCPKPEAVHAA